MIRAVLADLDGTLLDTAPELAAAANALLGELGRAPLAADTVREFIGQGIERLVRRCLEVSAAEARCKPSLYTTPTVALERFAAHYARLNGTLAQAYPGVRDGLAAMRGAGLRLGCVTNKAARFTRPLLAATGLAQYFDAVVTADEAGCRKPDPGIFLHACRQLGVDPAEAAVIGDSANDAVGGRAAGCRVYLVPYGYREGRDVRELVCDGIVESLRHAASVLATQS